MDNFYKYLILIIIISIVEFMLGVSIIEKTKKCQTIGFPPIISVDICKKTNS